MLITVSDRKNQEEYKMPKSKVFQSPTKRSRRLNVRVLSKAEKSISRRPYPPGQHGPSRRGKLSDFALQLQEKQRAKFIYGLRERQFRNIYSKAQKDKNSTGLKLLQLLECRLDNVIYRSGMAKTRRQARQMVTHCHFKINDKVVNIPSFVLHKNDVAKPVNIENFKFNDIEPINWIKIDNKKISATLIKIPLREELPFEVDEQLIVEYYSR